VSERFVWPNIQRDCRNWDRTCEYCQRSKVSRHVTAPHGNFPIPSSRFQHIHIDLIGPLPSVNTYRYCLTVVDRFTRWPEVCPLQNTTAKDVAEALLNCWISRFGIPCRITTDQGRQFESDLFRRLGITLGFERHRTCSYHPCSNGMVERFHRQLKAAIMCHKGTTWLQSLPIVLLGIRSAFRTDLTTSSAELVYGEPLRLPGELVIESKDPRRHEDISDFVVQLRSVMNKLRPTPGSNHGNRTPFVFQHLKTCSHVFLRDDSVRKSLQPPYTGPYQVVERDEKTITIWINGHKSRVSIDRVKPAYLVSEEAQNKMKNLLSSPSPSDQLKQSDASTTRSTRSGRKVTFQEP